MTERQTPTELTTRDVLLQIDRRLTRIEDDQRDSGTRHEAQIGDLRKDMNARFAAIDVKFQWTLGIVLASWLSIMGTLLLK